MNARRLLILCDWLPPDFGAVGQYTLLRARAAAAAGHRVTLVGFSSGGESIEREGRLTIRRLARRPYDRGRFLRRAFWTLSANLALRRAARTELAASDELMFTGAPPYLIHFVLGPARRAGVATRYRITDFHPETLAAALERTPWWLVPLLALTRWRRRQVDRIEVLGEDQRRRLTESGVAPERIELVPDGSPVEFALGLEPASRPPELAGRRVLLYSGNFGVAHEHATLIDGLAQLEPDERDRIGLWLNATGARVAAVAAECERTGMRCVRTAPVALDRLAAVLLAADVHLITLANGFEGYVLPSKVHAAIASGRPILYLGPEGSDVHRLCAAARTGEHYRRVAAGDAAGCAAALRALLLR